MIKIFAKAGCGCCSVEMSFRDEEAASTAFQKAGLGNVEITDDKGEEHRVDSFYGFTLEEGEVAERGLDFLMGQLLEK